MSVQAVRDFWKKANDDPALQKHLDAVPRGAKEAAVPAIMRVAAAAGFAFTAEEYETAVREELARRHQGGEISDDQLARLAGGKSPVTWDPACYGRG
jgi:predicted ribosomally synthesized peptide with nif11-like leader